MILHRKVPAAYLVFFPSHVPSFYIILLFYSIALVFANVDPLYCTALSPETRKGFVEVAALLFLNCCHDECYNKK